MLYESPSRRNGQYNFQANVKQRHPVVLTASLIVGYSIKEDEIKHFIKLGDCIPR